MKIIADIGKICDCSGFFHKEVMVILGDEQDFGKKGRIIHFGDNIFYLILGIALGVFSGF